MVTVQASQDLFPNGRHASKGVLRMAGQIKKKVIPGRRGEDTGKSNNPWGQQSLLTKLFWRGVKVNG
jgi:hypothetical protein